MNEEIPILDANDLLTDRRRREWVEVCGRRVCVWEMNASEAMQLAENSARPRIDPRGGIDNSQRVIWQIALSCHKGEGPDSPLIFNPLDPAPILMLRLSELRVLNEAIERVNGTSDEELGALQDFMLPKRDETIGGSNTGALNTSTVSLRK